MTNLDTIAAGIVLYNPQDKNRIRISIEAVLNQVNQVYIFDNSTNEVSYSFPPTVTYMTEYENKGIAYALNRIMEAAQKDGFNWVITMDQDSILPDGTVYRYERHILDDSSLAIICPQVVDSRRSYMEIKTEPKEEYLEFCITSASCTNLSAWENVGGFDEWLFIDLVDNEFCKRLIVSGYKILRLNELVLNQEFGEIMPKSEKTQKFWKKVSQIVNNENFAKLGYSKFVSPMRVYYTNRNIIYVNRKLKNYGNIGYRENYNCNSYLGFLISFTIPSILRAQNKAKVMKAVVRGIRDGMIKKPEMWKVVNK